MENVKGFGQSTSAFVNNEVGNYKNKMLEDENKNLRFTILKLNENLKEKSIAYEQLRKEKCERHNEPYQDPEEVKLD